MSEIDDVKAANSASAKNTVAKIAPPGIAPNATGMETKKRLGPPAGSSPAANTMGKMAKPAIRATSVSDPTTMNDERGMLVSFDR